MYRVKQTLVLLFIFLLVGFILGTFTLSVIVQNLVHYIREAAWLIDYENIIIRLVILLFVIYSALIAWWIKNNLVQMSFLKKFLSISILLIIALYCLWYWYTPKIDERNYTIISKDGRFHGGPYPSRAKIIALKKQGYTAIISLLSPYVIPFEPDLIKKEDTIAKELGIKVIKIPMLPWITKNEESIKEIKKIAQEKNNNKYYVHCYYGSDRLSIFMRIVNGSSAINYFTKPEELNDIKIKQVQFELGKAIEINNRVIFAPLPTEDEYLRFIVTINNKYFSNPIESVIAINPLSDQLTKEEQKLKKLNIPIQKIVLSNYPYDSQKILDLARKIKLMPKLVIIYQEYDDNGIMPDVLNGIMDSYLTNLPSLPKQLIQSTPIKNGEVKILGYNAASGPRPTENEFDSYLYGLGFRSMVYIGNCNDQVYKEDRLFAINAKLTPYCLLANDKGLLALVSKEGPWYLYGPELSQIESIVQNNFQKKINFIEGK